MLNDTTPASTEAQDEALRLADTLDGGKLIDDSTEWADTLHTAAATLRSLHIEVTEQARLLGISAEREMALRARVRELEAARIAYASEFELNADGEPDVGSIHANIRALKSQLSAPRQCLHGISEPSGWRDIETAPKDSGYVLLRGRREQDVASGYWLQSAYAGNGAWIWPFVHMTPMLWTPLPPGPLQC